MNPGPPPRKGGVLTGLDDGPSNSNSFHRISKYKIFIYKEYEESECLMFSTSRYVKHYLNSVISNIFDKHIIKNASAIVAMTIANIPYLPYTFRCL